MDPLEALRSDDRLVLGGLSAGAAVHPGRPALTYGPTGQSFTYGELQEQVDRVAGGLTGLGAQQGDRISVFAQRSLTPTLAMFAIWQLGAVFAPVNFNLRGPLLADQLTDTRPRLLIVDDELVPALLSLAPEALAGITVIVDGDQAFEGAARWADVVSGPPSNAKPAELSPYDVANIIYTSGTTGRPKGVVQSYRWMNQYTFALRRMIGPDDVVYNDLPMYHVGGAFANVGRAIWSGASVSLWDKFSPSEFWDRIALHQATSAVLLDVMIPWLMNADAERDDADNTLTTVHMQPLPTYHHDVATRFGIEWVSVGFGQTETGVACVAVLDERQHPSNPDELTDIERRLAAAEVEIVPGTRELAKGFMGKPVAFLEVDVVDEFDEPVSEGTQGNLVVRSKVPAALFTEYFNRPDATVEANRNHWFHTGDIVRREPTGVYYFVDRAGDRIRSRGENVSSLQVEDMLCSHPGVNLAAVLPVPAAEGLEHDIAAFLVLTAPMTDPEAEISIWIRANLPRYMQPKHLRFIDDLPRTPTNKVEKYRLRASLLAELAGG